MYLQKQRDLQTQETKKVTKGESEGRAKSGGWDQHIQYYYI